MPDAIGARFFCGSGDMVNVALSSTFTPPPPFYQRYKSVCRSQVILGGRWYLFDVKFRKNNLDCDISYAEQNGRQEYTTDPHNKSHSDE